MMDDMVDYRPIKGSVFTGTYFNIVYVVFVCLNI